jgi:hypothetical protein
MDCQGKGKVLRLELVLRGTRNKYETFEGMWKEETLIDELGCCVRKRREGSKEMSGNKKRNQLAFLFYLILKTSQIQSTRK